MSVFWISYEYWEYFPCEEEDGIDWQLWEETYNPNNCVPYWEEDDYAYNFEDCFCYSAEAAAANPSWCLHLVEGDDE